MLENISIQKILFLDVETVPVAADFSELPRIFKACGQKKHVGNVLISKVQGSFTDLKRG